MPENGEEPEVTETGYVAATKGPASDTETYYKATPAPGDWREDHGPPTQSSFTSKEPERLALRGKSKGGGSGEGRSIPWLWIGAGVLAIGFIGSVSVLVAIYALMSNPTPDEQPQEDEKTWEGLKVKKGLR
ncbi:MAG: hypothetical protein H6737_00240 [Alphaproteobacteria bacterium]|nr:hypothetical protein [Alphaproteobacteria bacterium]